ncbi:hypothetical protein [Actinoplanes sp. NPDC023714]|uniref:hypothetical protein n=1 Tax=Actinoplanes sp. NPDC023714 TaxID=3154322 RepID=UPI0033CEC093
MDIARSLAGLTALTAVAFGLTGCGGSSESGADVPGAASPASPAASATPALAPADELLAALPDAKTAAHEYASSGACVAVWGVVDAPNKAISTRIFQEVPEVKVSLTMAYLAFGTDDPYVKITVKPAAIGKRMGVGSSWYSIDPAEIDDFADSPFSYNGETDPLGAAMVIEAADDLTRAEVGRFSGTADLSDIAASHPILDEDAIKKLGDKAKAVPIEATVDPAGNLTKLAMKFPAAGKTKAGTCTIAYSGHNRTRPLSAPTAGEVKKATAAVYDLLED